MERQYLLKVIEKHFYVLSKEEIAQQITKADFQLPDFLVEALQTQDVKLNAISNLSTLNEIFFKAMDDVRKRIFKQDVKSFHLDPLENESIFDDALLLISVYYHYQATIGTAATADFIRLVLIKKTLLT